MQEWECVYELSMVKAGWPTGVAELCDINSLHKWPKITLAVIAAVTSSLTLGKRYLFLPSVSKKNTWQNLACWSCSQCLSLHCGLQSSLMCLTKDTESMLPMMCTSHLHAVHCINCIAYNASLCHLNWQILRAEIGLYQRREWMFYLFYHWCFCRLKLLSSSMTGLKISVQSKVCFCHKLVPELSSFYWQISQVLSLH